MTLPILINSALGFVEAPFFSITAVLADQILKNAQVQLLGIETTGNENLLIRLQGDVQAIRSALEIAEIQA